MAAKRKSAKAAKRPPVQSRSTSRARRIAFAVAAVVLALVIAIGIVEAAMRIFHIVPERHERPQTSVVSGGVDIGGGRKMVKVPSPLESLGVTMGEYVPGAVYKTIYDSNPRGYFDEGNSVINRINSLGLRGPEVTETPTTGTFRILALGDSFTFGPGVREEDTFVRQLEKNLRSDGQSVEVLNAGVEGYNTSQEVITLEKKWLRLQPDLVLVVFYLNDAYQDMTFLNQGETEGVQFAKPPGLAQYSYFYDFAQHAMRVRAESKKIEAYYKGHAFAAPGAFLETTKESVDWKKSKEAFARLGELSRQHDFKAAVVIFPELFRLGDSYPFKSIHEHVRATCEELKLPCLDLLSSFAGKRDKDLWVHPSDHHPNEKAHAIAASAIEAFLKQQQLIGEKP